MAKGKGDKKTKMQLQKTAKPNAKKPGTKKKTKPRSPTKPRQFSSLPENSKTKILIIGAGNMGGALAKGLHLSAIHKEVEVRVYDISIERIEKLTNEAPVQVVPSLDDAIDDDIVVLCVKPQDLPTVARQIKGRLDDDCLVISILAGTPMTEVAKSLDFSGAIVRAMSNIPAMVGAAATAMCSNEPCGDKHRDFATKIFQGVGEAYWTKESLMDAVTGLSGSGPAYIYMVIEALTDGGVKMGLQRQLASQLATQTVLGSALLVKSTGLHPAILRDQVTTPAGTTISAIHELEAHGLRAMLIAAVATATERSAELGMANKKTHS